jgi:DNA polymerase-3 subunit gamma/tau
MSQALYRKWRPTRFDEVVGQEHITRTLQNSVTGDRLAHAYLFCGPRGTGKTTMARLVAKGANCLHEDPSQRPCNECSVCQAINDGRFLDLIEIDAASNTGVDDIRDLRDKINFAPSEGRFKVYIIDEVHMLSTAAFNALLKTLEEPPPHAMFVLATTEEHKVPLTIKSRCQQFNFRLLTTAEIKYRLLWLSEKEGLSVEADALAMIADQGAGSIRDAESLLDQLVVAPGDTITLEQTQMVLGTATNTAVTALVNAWLNGDGATGLALIQDTLASGTDARQFCRQMVGYLRQLLLMQAAGEDIVFEGPGEQKEEMLAQAQGAPRQRLVEATKLFNEAALAPTRSWQPQLPLELAFIELLPDKPLAASRPPSTAASLVKSAKPEAVAAKAPIPTPDQPPDAVADENEEQIPDERPSEASQERSGADPFTLEQVKTHWRDMTALVGEKQRNLPALLTMGKPLALEGSTIIVGFDFPIFRKKFNDTAGAAKLLGETFSELMNTECNIRSVVTSDYTVPVPDEEFRSLADELGGVVSELPDEADTGGQ